MRSCLVLGCSNRADRDKIPFFKVPGITKRGTYLNALNTVRRQKWIAALRREDMAESSKFNHGYICAKHFIKGKPSLVYESDDPDWVPSVDMGYSETGDPTSRCRKFQRAQKFQSMKKVSSNTTDVKNPINADDNNSTDDNGKRNQNSEAQDSVTLPANDNDSLLSDEMECLQASFSSEEMHVVHFGRNTATVQFHILADRISMNSETTITIYVMPEYPSICPSISVCSSDLKQHDRKQVEERAREFCATLVGGPMILDLVIFIKNIIPEIKCSDESQELETSSSENDGVEDSYLVLMSIDHIRSESKYIKKLKSWSVELDVKGALLFFKKSIFLILHGKKLSVKNFIIRLRTYCVDVTSSGKSCKEKMSKILHDGFSEATFQEFSVIILDTHEDLKKYISNFNIDYVYSNFILSCTDKK